MSLTDSAGLEVPGEHFRARVVSPKEVSIEQQAPRGTRHSPAMLGVQLAPRGWEGPSCRDVSRDCLHTTAPHWTLRGAAALGAPSFLVLSPAPSLTHFSVFQQHPLS